MVKVGRALETKIVGQGLVKMVRHVNHLLLAGSIELSALEQNFIHLVQDGVAFLYPVK